MRGAGFAVNRSRENCPGPLGDAACARYKPVENLSVLHNQYSCATGVFMTSTASQPTPEALRHAMVASQLRPNAVNDPRLVAAMNRVPREAFLPLLDGAELAYRDTAVPLGHGRYQNVPIATGRLLTEANLQPADRVLLIGAACGYTAAVLAQLVASVVAVESDATLASQARAALADIPTVKLVEGALEAGHAAGAPYDVLVIDGSVERVPDALVNQLRAGGRAVAGIVDRGVTRLSSGRRTAGGFGLVPFADIECVALPGFSRPKTFSF